MKEIPLIYNYDDDRKAYVGDVTKVHLDVDSKEFVVLQPDLEWAAGTTNGIALENVTFEINEKLQQLTRDTGVKSIHARLRGTIGERTLELPSMEELEENWIELRYEPFEEDFFFVKATGERVDAADEVICLHRRMFMRKG